MNHRLARSALLLLLLLLLASLTGCPPQQSKPAPAAPPPLPKISDLAPADPAIAPSPDTPAPSWRLGRVDVQVLVYPLDDTRVELALGALTTPSLDAPLLSRWQANGFQIGMIDHDRLILFLANLPRTLGGRTTSIRPSIDYSPVTLIDRVPHMQPVRIVDETGQIQQRQFIGGQYRLMVKLAADLNDQNLTRIDILPHHFGPRDSLLPRTPQEKLLDGTSFTDLRIDQPLDTEHVWVIWGQIDRQALLQRGVQEADPNATDPQPPTIEQLARQQVAPPAPPPLLGEAMTTGRRGNKAVRVVIFIAGKS